MRSEDQNVVLLNVAHCEGWTARSFVSCPIFSPLFWLFIAPPTSLKPSLSTQVSYIRTFVHCGEVSEEKRFWCLIQKLGSCKNLYTPLLLQCTWCLPISKAKTLPLVFSVSGCKFLPFSNLSSARRALLKNCACVNGWGFTLNPAETTLAFQLMAKTTKTCEIFCKRNIKMPTKNVYWLCMHCTMLIPL